MPASVTAIFCIYKIGEQAGQKRFHSVWKSKILADKCAAVLNRTVYYVGEYVTETFPFTDNVDDHVKRLNIEFDRLKLKLPPQLSPLYRGFS